ncbi:MAG: ligase-associated DNA damage response endonuclease PdeM [Parachlamydiaceae bacterium]
MTKLMILDQTIRLLPEKAAFWEEKKALILADIHLGKATVFRQHGIPIPEGNMEEDLKRLERLIRKMEAKLCVIVGDLIHAKSGLTTELKDFFGNWLSIIDCEMHLVIGNHDKSLVKGLPKKWPIHIHQTALTLDPFYFSHYPMSHEKLFVWAGHLHPKIKLKSAHDCLLLPCFQIFSHLGILPAFSSFVGGAYVEKTPSCEIFIVTNSSVIQL